MKHDTQAPVVLTKVAKGLVDRHLAALGVLEVDIAHRKSHVAVHDHAHDLRLALDPLFQREARVVGIARIAADEVRERTLLRRAEGLRSERQGRLEQDGAGIVIVRLG